jgi:hypothetical protein
MSGDGPKADIDFDASGRARMIAILSSTVSLPRYGRDLTKPWWWIR